MNQPARLLAVLQFCALIAGQRTILDSPGNLQLYGQIRRVLFRAFVDRTSNQRRSENDVFPSVQEEIPPNVPFPCNVTGGRSSQVPTSVNRLRPGDIDIIGSMGDSLTAGNAVFATNLLELSIENRGVSGSSGGQGNWRTFTTLPNILKEFNPKLFGYALGDSYTAHSASQFNVAELGATSGDMHFMAQYLVNKIKKDPRVDMKNHWKLITLMIGSNDFCTNLCVVSSPWSILDDHKKDLIKTLRYLRNNLPRTYVALISSPHLETLIRATEGRDIFRCYLLTTFECPCLMALKYRSSRPVFYEVMSRWQDVEEAIAEYPEFHTKDFTVEFLPGIKRASIPLGEDGYPDLSYLAYDCFHVSQKANALYGNVLWNNLLEPYGNKSTDWHPLMEKFLCPTEKQSFLVTRGNSGRSNNLI